MTNKPEISVIFTVRNCAQWIEPALRSVKQQSHQDWEVVALDDGSTDATPDVLAGLARVEPRIRVIAHDTTGGINAARNTAVNSSRADTMVFLEANETFAPDYLANVSRLSSRADIVFFCCDVVSEIVGPQYGMVGMIEPARVLPNIMLLQQPPFGALVAAVSERVFKMGLEWDESLENEEDWRFWQRAIARGAKTLCVGRKSGTHYLRPPIARSQPRRSSSPARVSLPPNRVSSNPPRASIAPPRASMAPPPVTLPPPPAPLSIAPPPPAPQPSGKSVSLVPPAMEGDVFDLARR